MVVGLLIFGGICWVRNLIKISDLGDLQREFLCYHLKISNKSVYYNMIIST